MTSATVPDERPVATGSARWWMCGNALAGFARTSVFACGEGTLGWQATEVCQWWHGHSLEAMAVLGSS